MSLTTSKRRLGKLTQTLKEGMSSIEGSTNGLSYTYASRHDYTVKAKIKAISYRKGRWICFGIVLVIIVVVVIVVITQVA